jgi:hypothetical protein
MPAATPRLVADTPAPDQGETAENPIPAPKARSRRANAAIATPPAATAAHDMADIEASPEMGSDTALREISTATSP